MQVILYSACNTSFLPTLPAYVIIIITLEASLFSDLRTPHSLSHHPVPKDSAIYSTACHSILQFLKRGWNDLSQPVVTRKFSVFTNNILKVLLHFFHYAIVFMYIYRVREGLNS